MGKSLINSLLCLNRFKQGITAHGVKTKRPLLRQQVRPSKILGKLFYNLPNEKQTPLPLIDGYIACLRRL